MHSCTPVLELHTSSPSKPVRALWFPVTHADNRDASQLSANDSFVIGRSKLWGWVPQAYRGRHRAGRETR